MKRLFIVSFVFNLVLGFLLFAVSFHANASLALACENANIAATNSARVNFSIGKTYHYFLDSDDLSVHQNRDGMQLRPFPRGPILCGLSLGLDEPSICFVRSYNKQINKLIAEKQLNTSSKELGDTQGK